MNRINDVWIQSAEMIEKKYPNLDLQQLGSCIMTIGMLRVTLGHDNGSDSVRDYVHVIKSGEASVEIIECMEFLEREIFGLTKSRLDIDTYQTGNKKNIKQESKYSAELDISILQKVSP